VRASAQDGGESLGSVFGPGAEPRRARARALTSSLEAVDPIEGSSAVTRV